MSAVGRLRARLRARLGVRVVTALAAAVSVAVVLVVAGAALVLLTDRLLRDSLRETATQQAAVVAQRVEANFEDDVEENADDATAKRGDLVQVVRGHSDGDREVIGASNPLWSADPMSTLMPAPGDVQVDPGVRVTHRDGMEEDAPTVTEEALVVAYGTEVKGRDLVVYAAQPLDDVHDAVETVFHLVLLGIPLLVLVTGAVTYLAAGRALRPVEAIRARVAAAHGDLSVRVPVPPAHDEVGRLAETMNAMLVRLQAAQAAQRRFVADASHELRSPLATIATGLELLSRGDPDPDTVATLRGETERLGRLVDALLLLARADERGLAPRREDVDLDEVVQAEQRRPAASAAVGLRVDAEPVRVVGDRGQLAQVVRNLVDNACRHARSQVLVTVRRGGTGTGAALLDVADDGPGVPAGQRARVFERFVRLDDARARADGGAGLGLAIVAEVVAAHGGTVDVVDGPSGGALFRVRLPLSAEEVPGGPPPGRPASDDQRDRPAGDGRDPAPVEPGRSTRSSGRADGQPASAIR